MSRSKRAKSTVSVELFPFLAVLMCTMGALILVLLAIARNSHRQAQAAALAASVPQHEQQSAERQNLLSRAALLEQDRDVSNQELVRRRQEIAELATLGRRLRQELAELEAALAAKADPSSTTDQEMKDKLALLRRQIAETTVRLHQARKEAEDSSRSFAVIPYIGANGTRRRPIYIECCGDGVILQPEGITLAEADFPENVLSINPLSAGVQAAATYYERLGSPDAREEPYPLLLVRPDGIGAYYAARAALKSWGADFGYEFVDPDWKLRYDPPNPRLAELQRLAIQDARGKQRMMALAAPSRHKGRVAGFRVSGTGGGLVRDDNGQPAAGEPRRDGTQGNSGVPGGDSFGGFAAGRSSSAGSDHGGSTRGSLAGNSAGGIGQGSYRGSGSGSAFNDGTFSAGNGAQGNRGFEQGTGNGETTGLLDGNAAGDGSTGGDSLLASSDGRGGDRLLGVRQASGGRFASGNRGNGAGDSPLSTGDEAALGGAGSGDSEDGSGMATGGGTANGGRNPQRSAGNNRTGGNAAGSADGSSSSGGASGGGSGSSSGADSMGSAGGAAMPSLTFGKPPAQAASDSDAAAAQGKPTTYRMGEYHEKLSPEERREMAEQAKRRAKEAAKKPAKQSLADSKGKNWALPDASQYAIALTRPIRIECAADHLRIIPERRGDHMAKRIEFGDHTENSVDELVSDIWDHMRGWGIAGKGMYWKPVLQVEVAPGGEERYSELAALLDGSGLTVREKKVPAQRQRRPPQQPVLR